MEKNTEKKLKVVTYIPHGDVPDIRGYAPAIVAQYLQSQLENIHHYFITNNESGKSASEQTEHGQVFRISESRVYRRIFRKITRIDPYPLHVRMARLVQKNPVDIIHVHQIEFPLKSVLKRLDSCTPKVVVHVHSIRAFRDSWGIADIYLAVSDYTKNIMIKDKGYPADKVEVLHNGVDTSQFTPAKNHQHRAGIRSKLHIRSDALVLGYVGRKQQAKGYYEYLKCVERFATENGSIIGLCAGPQPESSKSDPLHSVYTALEKKLVEEGKLISLPSLKHDQLCDIYRAINILIFATRQEQHPVVALESMASGCITIASAVGGIPETISHGKDGFLIQNPLDLEEIYTLVSDCLNDSSMLSKMATNARKRIEDHFSWHSRGVKLKSIYDNLLINQA